MVDSKQIVVTDANLPRFGLLDRFTNHFNPRVVVYELQAITQRLSGRCYEAGILVAGFNVYFGDPLSDFLLPESFYCPATIPCLRCEVSWRHTKELDGFHGVQVARSIRPDQNVQALKLIGRRLRGEGQETVNVEAMDEFHEHCSESVLKAVRTFRGSKQQSCSGNHLAWVCPSIERDLEVWSNRKTPDYRSEL